MHLHGRSIDGQVLDEIRSVVWLAQATGSAAIIPNLLGCETGTDLQRADAVPLYHGQVTPLSVAC